MEWDSGDCGTCCTEANLLVELEAAEGDLAGLAVLAGGAGDGGGPGAGDLLCALVLATLWRNLHSLPKKQSASLVVPAEPRIVPKLPILALAQLLPHKLDGGGGGLRLLC